MKVINFQFNISEIYQNRDLLRDMLKSLLTENCPELTEPITTADKALYDEPLLYYYLLESKDRYPIEQIVSGYLPVPIYGDDMIIPVKPDINRLVYMPAKGYLTPSQEPVKYGSFNPSLQADQKLVFEARQYVADTDIELYEFVPAIVLDNDPDLAYSPQELLSANCRNIHLALIHIKTNNAALFDLINLCTKNICLFKSDTLNSFASITQQGTCFINVVDETPSEVFFIDDIAHQCGHIIFNILTVKTEDFLNFPKDTLIKQFAESSTDDRTIYSIFHGLFTYSCILSCLDACLQADSFDGNSKNKLEAQARLGFYLTKMFLDLENAYGKNIFTLLGETYYKSFIENYQYMFDKYYETTRKFNYINQPYVFCFDQFLKDNQP